MTTVVLFARETNIADVDDEPPAGDEGAIAVFPDGIERADKRVIVDDVAELVVALVVPLERPIRR